MIPGINHLLEVVRTVVLQLAFKMLLCIFSIAVSILVRETSPDTVDGQMIQSIKPQMREL